ncbi:unnamed protein product [Ceutorhynchus assimilis]|uniref:SKICH domain-containing protein n=1 Tax=Ceutorhynchus assimilis TaxID=467358 RepID=A0A9N9MJ55_9CUCU|nr:unnamed protein product [Ceutorhynchus assimilis]
MASLSSTALVTFQGIQDQYSLNSDLTFQFTFKSSQDFPLKDSLAIFKLGWNHVTEYVAIKSAPIDVSPEQIIYSVTFNQHILPKNIEDLFQVCYLRGQILCGASSPFQFTDNAMPTKDEDFEIVYDKAHKTRVLSEKDQEIERLKEENEILRESLRTLIISSKNKDTLKEIKGMKTMVLRHDAEIKMLKDKIRAGGEEYKKLYIENFMVKTRYDKLRAKMLGLNDDDEKCTTKKYEKSKTRFPYTDDEDSDDGIGVADLDLDDLKSIPPFPSILKK